MDSIVEYDPKTSIYILPEEIDENSGLIFYNNLFWTINDSDGEPIIYGFNTQNGNIKIRIKIKDATNNDWEDIAQDSTYIYIGDFGNNNGSRKNLRILCIPKDKITKDEKQNLEAEIINFSYEDQVIFDYDYHETSFDCEAIIAFQSNIILFTKDWLNRNTQAYKIPAKPGNYKAKRISSFNINGLVTAADLSPDKTELIILGYKNYMPYIWIFENFTMDNIFSKQNLRIEMPNIYNAQTEGIVFKNADSVFFSCEKSLSKNSNFFYKNVVFHQQMFVLPVSFYKDYFSTSILERKNRLK